MTHRAVYFRGVCVKLSCGHTTTIATGSYRITRWQASAIFGSAVRRGMWCFKCKHGCLAQPVEYLGTCRVSSMGVPEMKTRET